MTMFTLAVAVGLVAAAVLSYTHTRRFGTRRNAKLTYPLLGALFFIESALNSIFPGWNLDSWCLRPLMLLWFALMLGSLLTWRRVNYRGNNWAQIVALRERNAKMKECYP